MFPNIRKGALSQRRTRPLRVESVKFGPKQGQMSGKSENATPRGAFADESTRQKGGAEEGLRDGAKGDARRPTAREPRPETATPPTFLLYND